ncbi:hypothetical protein H5410_024182 [Solanum commersonii]|uniref:Uncharacterized protein n=1 Tax=Solanum commersonii TaxID=4109 RepID=A0A9J5ZL85_SOLCO|nr:hypothetical protein H5410_024182 [Solanum commersonii]
MCPRWLAIAGVPDLKGYQQAATECEQSQGDGINSIELGFFITAEVTKRNVGLIQYRIPDLHRRLMVGAAFLGKKDSGKRMLIKNRRLMSTPSAVATTLLHPDKMTRTGEIIAMRLYYWPIKERQDIKLVPKSQVWSSGRTRRYTPHKGNWAVR